MVKQLFCVRPCTVVGDFHLPDDVVWLISERQIQHVLLGYFYNIDWQVKGPLTAKALSHGVFPEIRRISSATDSRRHPR